MAKAPVSKTGDSRFESWLPRSSQARLRRIIATAPRAWCNGRTRPFQGLSAGSSPVARSQACPVFRFLSEGREEHHADGRFGGGGSSRKQPRTSRSPRGWFPTPGRRVRLRSRTACSQHSRGRTRARQDRFLRSRRRDGSRKLDKELRPFVPQLPLTFPSLLYVSLLVRQVVLAVVRGMARATHVVALAHILSPPRELRERLELPTPSAPPQLASHRTYVRRSTGRNLA